MDLSDISRSMVIYNCYEKSKSILLPISVHTIFTLWIYKFFFQRIRFFFVFFIILCIVFFAFFLISKLRGSRGSILLNSVPTKLRPSLKLSNFLYTDSKLGRTFRPSWPTKRAPLSKHLLFLFNDTRKVKVLSLPETIKEKSTFRAKAPRRELVSPLTPDEGPSLETSIFPLSFQVVREPLPFAYH